MIEFSLSTLVSIHDNVPAPPATSSIVGVVFLLCPPPTPLSESVVE